MSDAWFAEKLAPEGVADDGCHPQEAQALQGYMHRKTSAQEAARAITRPVESAADPGAHLARLWGFLIDALVELPETQTAGLVQLLDAVQSLPEPDLTGRRTVNTPPDGFLWRDLPGFGHQWADEHKRDDWRGLLAESDPAQRSTLRALHVKKARIEAQFVIAAIGAFPLDWGYDCICDALERKDPVSDFEVPAAAAWLALAGDRIRAGAVGGQKSWALERRRDLWSGDNAMSLERWSFWESRLEALLDKAEATQDAARAAIRDMQASATASS